MSRRSIHYRDGKSHPDHHRRVVGTGRKHKYYWTGGEQFAGDLKRVPGENTGKVCSLPMKPEKAARILARLPKKSA